MNTATEQPLHDRRSRTRKEIKQLIAERNSVLSQYYSLVSQTEEESTDRETLADLLQEFCQDLVDYLATGHFEIYRRLEEGEERRGVMVRLADEVYESFNETTQVAVAFNDFYDFSEGRNLDAIDRLPEQLSRLGQVLASRIEIEDRFINTLLTGKAEETAEEASA